MLRVFIGYDERQSVAYNVARFSLERRSSKPTSIMPLRIEALPITRQGLTRFTFSRFLVPWLCGYQGRALFLDSDFLILGDIAELFDRPEENKAVWVSKNPHKFEWASMILFDCAHPANAKLTPEFVETASGLHQINWTSEDLVGDLPRDWNVLAGYDEPIQNPKGVHYTQGMPIFEETTGSPYKDEWLAEHKVMNSTQPWAEVMGNSVHTALTKEGRKVARLHVSATSSMRG